MFCDRDRLNQPMEQEGLDIMVATAAETIYYLTGNRSVNKSLRRGAQIYKVVARDAPGVTRIVAPTGFRTMREDPAGTSGALAATREL